MIITPYLTGLGASCFLLQFVVLLAFLRFRAVRAWLRPLYCFVHPLLYLAFIEPEMTPRLSVFRAVLWVIFACYWTIRIFGALLPVPRVVRRGLTHAVWLACAAVLLRSCFAGVGEAGGDLPYILLLMTGGFVLLLIPALVMRDQLWHEPLPVLDSSRATMLTLAIAAVLGGNSLLTQDLAPLPARFEEEARVRGVNAGLLAAMRSPRTPLRKLFDSALVEELLFDQRDQLAVAPVLVDVPIGPFRVTPREALMAVRKTGTPFSKDLRPTPQDVPKVVAGPAVSLRKAEILESLLSETDLRIGALVLAACQAEEPRICR